MSKPTINVKLLRRVKALILEEPRRLDMGTWAHPADKRVQVEADRPPCGTVACIAGWAVIDDFVKVNGRMPDRDEIEEIYETADRKAAELLSLRQDQADRLFDTPTGGGFDEWPEDLAEAYVNATSPKERARVAAKRIERFIKTKGAE